MVGGPSIIFHRYHESGATKLRDHLYGEAAKTCQSIVGYDANVLYYGASCKICPVDVM